MSEMLQFRSHPTVFASSSTGNKLQIKEVGYNVKKTCRKSSESSLLIKAATNCAIDGKVSHTASSIVRL